MPINETHDPKLKSWVESANDPGTEFPIQNLPLATRVARDEDGDPVESVVTAIGDHVVDLNAIAVSDLVDDDDDEWAFFGLDALLGEVSVAAVSIAGRCEKVRGT